MSFISSRSVILNRFADGAPLSEHFLYPLRNLLKSLLMLASKKGIRTPGNPILNPRLETHKLDYCTATWFTVLREAF